MVIWDTLDLAVLQSCHFDGGFSPQNSTCRLWCLQNFNEELVSDSPSQKKNILMSIYIYIYKYVTYLFDILFFLKGTSNRQKETVYFYTIIYIYIYGGPPPKPTFFKKHWFLQCFRHILTSRFGKLRLGGHISSSYIKIYDIHCTTKKCGMFRNTSVSKTEKLKNCFFQRHPGRDSP